MHSWPDLGCQWSQQNLQLHWNDLSIGLQYCSPQKFLPLLEMRILISFRKSLHPPLWCFDSIEWERSWSSFSLKNFISCLKSARTLHFSSANSATCWRWAMLHSSTHPVKKRTPLTTRCSSLRCVSTVEYHTAILYSKTGQDKTPKESTAAIYH